ncbi:MAG: glycosyltransferase [Acidimicrobiales bacterium]
MTKPSPAHVLCSVVIPTHDRASSLHRVLSALAASAVDAACFEVVVVVDGPDDDTVDMLEAAAPPFDLIVVEQENAGPASARNRGVGTARGDVVVFLDDDVMPSPQWLGRHLERHQSGPDQLVVVGPMLTPQDHDFQPWVRWEQCMLERSYAALLAGEWQPSGRLLYTGNASMRRSFFLEAGGFDETLRRAEDVDLGYRLEEAGGRFEFAADAHAYHYAERELAAWLDMARSYGRADATFAVDGGRTWLLESLAREFHERRAPNRALVVATVGRPTAVAIVQRLLVAGAVTTARVVWPLASVLFSGAFNLRYYDSFASAIGGRRSFLDFIAAGHDERRPA